MSGKDKGTIKKKKDVSKCNTEKYRWLKEPAKLVVSGSTAPSNLVTLLIAVQYNFVTT